MTDSNTPAESPYAKHLGGRRASNGDLSKLSRRPPELAPLPPNPSPLDVALRYGSDSAWLRAQWPPLLDAVIELQDAVRTQRATHWAWPLLTGLCAAGMLASWLPRLFGH
jgi:hypothetical protein